jgi:hypothetical protein
MSSISTGIAVLVRPRYGCGMYPLIETSLTLLELARHWSRSFPERLPADELADRLLQAVWSGELLVCGEDGSAIQRERLFHMVRQTDASTMPHPGIVIYDDPSDLPPEVRILPDGGAEVSLAHRLRLPTDPSLWTPEIVADACTVLASCRMRDFSSLIHPKFVSLRITNDAFAAFCIGRGYELPGFWFARSTAGTNKPKSYGGRPSVVRQIEGEMRRRAARGNLAPRLREEATALYHWAKTAIDASQQIPKPGAIENTLRKVYKELKAAAASAHKT